MKRKILIAIYIILILFTLKILYNTVTNSILLGKYSDGEYDTRQAERLTYINFLEKYVAYYNYGNILYQNGEYESAISNYKLALSCVAPKNKRCNIRINCALAMCKTVQVDEKNQDSIKSAIKTYEFAIDVLTEEGCANKSDSNGHSLKAERLKKDIQKEIDKLKKLQEQQNSDNSDENNNEENNKSQEKTETIEQKIQSIKEDATKDQRDVEYLYNNYGKDFTFHDNKNW